MSERAQLLGLGTMAHRFHVMEAIEIAFLVEASSWILQELDHHSFTPARHRDHVPSFPQHGPCFPASPPPRVTPTAP